MKTQKIRLDNYLWQNGYSDSRKGAGSIIMSGWVKVNGETVRDPLRDVTGDEEIKISRPGGKYVSRGGYKLEHALKIFDIQLDGRVAADLGASTGGFTQCMLDYGAEQVYAVDVGYGQFDFSLRNDKRVVLKERTNISNLSENDFKRRVEFVSIDLSFISVKKAFDKIINLFNNIEGVVLIKPQFEAIEGEHDKGVVKDKEIHKKILSRVMESLMAKGIKLMGLIYSPLKGPAGNIEFLLHFRLNATNESSGIAGRINIEIDDTVEAAHAGLD